LDGLKATRPQSPKKKRPAKFEDVDETKTKKKNQRQPCPRAGFDMVQKEEGGQHAKVAPAKRNELGSWRRRKGGRLKMRHWEAGEFCQKKEREKNNHFEVRKNPEKEAGPGAPEAELQSV